MFSLLDHYTASPYIILTGAPQAGKSVFMKQLQQHNQLAHDQQQQQKNTPQPSFAPINYRNEYSFLVKEDNDLNELIQIRLNEKHDSDSHVYNRSNAYFILFVDASTICKNQSLALKIKNWLHEERQKEVKQQRERAELDPQQQNRSSRIVIAVSHLDRDEAASIDEIDSTIQSHQYKKLLCNCEFPNFEKQVDAIVKEIGDASGAQNNLLKEAMRGTEQWRQKLSQEASETSKWLSQQSNEFAETISHVLSQDDSKLARVVLLGSDRDSKEAVFDRLISTEASKLEKENQVDGSSPEEEVSLEVVRNFVGCSFKLYSLPSETSVSNENKEYLSTSNALVYVVHSNVSLDDQQAYYENCLKEVSNGGSKSHPSLVVVSATNKDAASALAEQIRTLWKLDAKGKGQFVCTNSELESAVPEMCSYLTEKQHIKTRERNIIAGLLGSLPDVHLEEGLHSSLEWTKQQQAAIARQLDNMRNSVSGSVQEYTPQIQETLGRAQESVTEGVKNVSSAMSSYWNSWWGEAPNEEKKPEQ